MEWLDRRDIADLDPRAEHALRAAGLHFHEDARAERHLAEAKALAPEHPAVLLAHYRYHFYKHRYPEAELYARRCLAKAAADLGLPEVLLDTAPGDADFTAADPQVRFWLFGMQALGYVLMRQGRESDGRALLSKVIQLDPSDQTKTALLVAAIDRAGVDAD